MADYFPLIARAVSGLIVNTGENRRALYDRARSALIAQLRGVQPALEETDITIERIALEEAIRKVEANSSNRFPPQSPSQVQPPSRIPDALIALSRLLDISVGAAFERDGKIEDPLPNLDDLPSVPAPRPAAIEPVWDKGRLTIPKQPATTDLDQKTFGAALSALRVELRDLASDVGHEANIDNRFVEFFKRISERIPESAPPQDELFRLGHTEQVFASYRKIVDEEWPNFLASRYHAVVLQFDRTLRQSQLWREFKKNAEKETLNADQIGSSPTLAKQVANILREEEATAFVDPALPDSLDKMANTLSEGSPTDAIEAGLDLLAFDILESINNTLKPIAEQALSFFEEYAKGMGKGFASAARKQAPVDGEKVFKWFRRAVITGGTLGLASLIAAFPDKFGWLAHVIKFLLS